MKPCENDLASPCELHIALLGFSSIWGTIVNKLPVFTSAANVDASSAPIGYGIWDASQHTLTINATNMLLFQSGIFRTADPNNVTTPAKHMYGALSATLVAVKNDGTKLSHSSWDTADSFLQVGDATYEELDPEDARDHWENAFARNVTLVTQPAIDDTTFAQPIFTGIATARNRFGSVGGFNLIGAASELLDFNANGIFTFFEGSNMNDPQQRRSAAGFSTAHFMPIVNQYDVINRGISLRCYRLQSAIVSIHELFHIWQMNNFGFGMFMPDNYTTSLLDGIGSVEGSAVYIERHPKFTPSGCIGEYRLRGFETQTGHFLTGMPFLPGPKLLAHEDADEFDSFSYEFASVYEYFAGLVGDEDTTFFVTAMAEVRRLVQSAYLDVTNSTATEEDTFWRGLRYNSRVLFDTVLTSLGMGKLKDHMENLIMAHLLQATDKDLYWESVPKQMRFPPYLREYLGIYDGRDVMDTETWTINLYDLTEYAFSDKPEGYKTLMEDALTNSSGPFDENVHVITENREVRGALTQVKATESSEFSMKPQSAQLFTLSQSGTSIKISCVGPSRQLVFLGYSYDYDKPFTQHFRHEVSCRSSGSGDAGSGSGDAGSGSGDAGSGSGDVVEIEEMIDWSGKLLVFNNHDGDDDPTPSVVTINGMKRVFSGLIVTNTETSEALNASKTVLMEFVNDGAPVGYQPFEFDSLPLVHVKKVNSTESSEGCEPADYAGMDLAGKAVLIQRGTCSFSTKWKSAAGAGAKLVIMHLLKDQDRLNMAHDGYHPETAGTTMVGVEYEEGMKYAAVASLYDTVASLFGRYVTYVGGAESNALNLDALTLTPGLSAF